MGQTLSPRHSYRERALGLRDVRAGRGTFLVPHRGPG